MATCIMPVLVAACGAPGNSAPHDASSAYAIETPASDTDGLVRILVYHDMEGLSGQGDWRTYVYRFPEPYRRGQALLAADVNAVIDGLFAGGADEVHVVDAHGSGNPEPDIPPESLDPRAEQLFRDQPFDPYVDLVEPGVYDAVVAVGMHAATGSGGYAAHTVTLGIDLQLQGRSITETELVAFSWGRVGVPLIFASGDDRLGADLGTMPWIEYGVVKHAVRADSARLRPVNEARAELRNRAMHAVQGLPRMRAVRLNGPVRAAVRAVPPASLTALEGLPGIDYEDNLVRFTAPDFRSAYDGWRALIRVAQEGYMPPFFETVEAHAEGQHLLDAASDRLDAIWLDYESGRWTAPESVQGDPGRRYHGVP